MLLCCLWRNVEASCHKDFVVVSREKSKRRRLPATIAHLPLSSEAACIALCGQTVHSTRWSQMANNRDFCLPHLHSTPPLGGGGRRNIAITFGVKYLEWCGYSTVKKLQIRLFVSTECTNVTDRQTNRQTERHTPHDGKDALMHKN